MRKKLIQIAELAAFGVIAYGMWLWAAPAGFIAAGLLSVAWLTAVDK